MRHILPLVVGYIYMKRRSVSWKVEVSHRVFRLPFSVLQFSRRLFSLHYFISTSYLRALLSVPEEILYILYIIPYLSPLSF